MKKICIILFIISLLGLVACNSDKKQAESQEPLTIKESGQDQPEEAVGDEKDDPNAKTIENIKSQLPEIAMPDVKETFLRKFKGLQNSNFQGLWLSENQVILFTTYNGPFGDVDAIRGQGLYFAEDGSIVYDLIGNIYSDGLEPSLAYYKFIQNADQVVVEITSKDQAVASYNVTFDLNTMIINGERLVKVPVIEEDLTYDSFMAVKQACFQGDSPGVDRLFYMDMAKEDILGIYLKGNIILVEYRGAYDLIYMNRYKYEFGVLTLDQTGISSKSLD